MNLGNGMSLLAVLLILIYCDDKEVKIIQSEYQSYFGVFYTSLRLDKQNLTINKEINMAVDFTLLTQEHLIKAEPIDNTNITLANKNTQIEVKEYSEPFSFLSESPSASSESYGVLNYYTMSERANQFNVLFGFSFAYRVRDSKFSIAHQLKLNGLIDHLSFGFTRVWWHNTNFGVPTTSGIIHFGGSALKNQTSGSCDVDRGEIKWTCRLSSVVLLKDNDTEAERYVNIGRPLASFMVNQYKISAPFEFMLYLNRTFFSKHVEERNCSFKVKEKESSVHSAYFQCECNYLHKLPLLEFAIGEYSYRIKMYQFFIHYDHLCELAITSNENNSWEFGNVFIEQFNSLFDYDNHRISFSTDRPNIITHTPIRTTQERNSMPNTHNDNTIAMISLTSIISCLGAILAIGMKMSLSAKGYPV